ncbi:MAG: GNAT family N-acetyltransferase [Rhodospirillales bacterium]|nr:GNAT family N-acetyltransferase [Alphaproteobacteria bacterium]MCB9986079.1 GNAT family N-acetyltransferase [Rhodospirillales bacterium]USO07354.1 MAG: GNAT family N-acetyltransferase [Rhodospirillales bacterium]
MDNQDIRVIHLKSHDIERAARFFNYDRTGYDDRALRECMAQGAWGVLLAETADGVDIGGCYLNWVPKYPLYRRLELPELQDLRVSPDWRRRGVATRLIATCEDMARGGGARGMGLSVGLYADYGPAQRLYTKLGYVPDGQGVTYDRVAVVPGARHPVDDDLTLMLLKFF